MQRSRHVLPSIDHGRVKFFLKEWRDGGVSAAAAAEHPAFAAALRRFAVAWMQN